MGARVKQPAIDCTQVVVEGDGCENERRVYTVGELTGDIKALLSDVFTDIWVEGEVSGVRLPQSGHAYFTLKDADAQMPCVMWKAQRAQLPFDIAEGQQLLCAGRVSVYEPQGKYQLYVHHIEPKGWGALQLAFEQLKERLGAAGFFDTQRKRALPLWPTRVAVITSATGDAVHDVLRHLEHDRVGIHTIVYPVRVQGNAAAAEMAQAIADLNVLHERLPIDLIFIGRGGGSKEDLWAFNEEVLAHAIYRSEVPVMTGVGHTEDCTIADLVADIRANTPTNAADMIKEQKLAMIDRCTLAREQVYDRMCRRLSDVGHRLEVLRTHYAFRRPVDVLEEWRQRMDEWQHRATRALQHRSSTMEHVSVGLRARLQALNPRQRIVQAHERLHHVHRTMEGMIQRTLTAGAAQTQRWIGQLDALSPLAILARGYSLTYALKAGALLKRTKDVTVGSQLRTQLNDGTVISRVELIAKEPAR